MTWKQGDQIGRIFAYWVIVYFGNFSENDLSSSIFGVTFFQRKGRVLTLTKRGWG
jgi:hypothetical protein